jgi:hypothetical protein
MAYKCRYHKFHTTRKVIAAFSRHLEEGKLSNVVRIYGEFSNLRGYRLHVVLDNGVKRTYTGFAWWYPGEGPRGLATCLANLGVKTATIKELLSRKNQGDTYLPNGFFIQKEEIFA